MVVATNQILEAQPDAVRQIYKQLSDSKRAMGLPTAGDIDFNPFGYEANYRNLELAIDCIFAQGLIDRRFTVDALFDDVTRAL